ncbi:MAG: OmpH family outer membrane protein [Alistipes sp.]|nr:OmpH family outer membrane protein [Candidatus Alistipes equi]
MKKLLCLALVLLAVVSCKNKETKEVAIASNNEVNELVSSAVVYVNVDAVMAQSEIAKQEGLPLRDKTEKAQNAWAQKEKNLQNDLAKLQEQYQKGLVTTREAQEKQAALEKRAQNFQTSAQTEAKTLEEENVVLQNRMLDLLQRAIASINEGGRYKMIVNSSALLDADSTLDITNAVLEKVNELYKSDK